MDSRKFCPTSLIDQSFGLCIGPEDVIFPFYNAYASNYYRPWKWYTQKTTKDFGSTIYNEKDKYKISLDVQHFEINEINVKVVDNEIIIVGNHEEREDSHGLISRHFKRRYFLPKNCTADSVVSTLSSDGILIVTADKNTELKNKEIRVPIKLCDIISNQQVITPKADINKLPLNIITRNDVDRSKECTTIMVKEDNCHMLKSEILVKPSAADTESENTMKQDEKKMDITCKTSIKTDQIQDIKESEKINDKSTESDIEAIAMMENVVESSATKMETLNMNCISSEILQMQQPTSSYSSSVSISLRETTEKVNKIASDISAQLKEAAENM